MNVVTYCRENGRGPSLGTMDGVQSVAEYMVAADASPVRVRPFPCEDEMHHTDTTRISRWSLG